MDDHHFFSQSSKELSTLHLWKKNYKNGLPMGVDIKYLRWII
jgi:hypothetical protein